MNGSKVGDAVLENVQYRFFGNLFETVWPKVKAEFERFDVDFKTDGEGGRLVDVYVHECDWGRSIFLAAIPARRELAGDSCYCSMMRDMNGPCGLCDFCSGLRTVPQ